jgi:hypothetical protein
LGFLRCYRNPTNVAEIDEEPPENDLSEQDTQQPWKNLLAIPDGGFPSTFAGHHGDPVKPGSP